LKKSSHKLKWLRKNFPVYGGFFDLPQRKRQLAEIEDKIAQDPDFWNDPQKSAPVLKQKKIIEVAITRALALESAKADLDAACELVSEGEEGLLVEAYELLNKLTLEIKSIETQSLLGGDLDINDAVLTINAGAGGTESCDWASMLMRMYVRFAERQGFNTEVFDMQSGDEAGVKSVTIGISGEFAFGQLKADSGVHRLVRISPFDSNARRHTSFASVFVSPVVDDNVEIDINPADLRIDTYRASGAGGQHINKTDSAVRITHAPSGIVVQCQNQRSQHQNKDQAMQLLRSALYERELAERQKQQSEVEAGKSEIGFGSQIRSYVLHPYHMVKDHRTNQETSDTGGVLDGNIDDFISAYLSNTAKPHTG
jgi:peptide chain release factor 2